MIKFLLEPYVGVLPIKFGMTPREVADVAGPPDAVSRGYLGNRHEHRQCLNLSYSERGVDEAVFLPGAQLTLHGQSLLDHPNPLAFLKTLDDSLFEWVGFIVFLKLGVRVSGIHDYDESQKSIGAVESGYWDKYMKQFTPYSGLDLRELRDIVQQRERDADRLGAFFELMEHPAATWRDAFAMLLEPEPVATQSAYYFHRAFKIPTHAGRAVTETAYWERVLRERRIDLSDRIRVSEKPPGM
jgi:hypothetical protein